MYLNKVPEALTPFYLMVKVFRDVIASYLQCVCRFPVLVDVPRRGMGD
jgi:hypothetical protein